MGDKLSCAQGHHWNSTIDRHRVASQHGLCPICGDVPLAVVTVAEPAHTTSRPASRAKRHESRPPTPPQADVLPPLATPTPEAPVVVTAFSVPAPAPPPVVPTPIEGMQWSRVDLGPSLPMTVFASTEPWHPERIGALALYCSDGRWGDAFDEFCHKRLLIPRYDRWAVPGGPAWLISRDDSKELVQAARRQLEFLVRVHELEKIVLITHYGCAYYRELLHKEPQDLLEVQMEDLRKGRTILHEWFPNIQVENYLAMRRENCLTFHQLNT